MDHSAEQKPISFRNATTVLADMPEGSDAANISFSPDGNYVAAIVKQNNAENININGIAEPSYESVKRPVFRKGFAGYAYEARRSKKACVVINGKEGKWYDLVDRLFFNSRGDIMYAAKQGKRWYIVSGRRKIETSGPLPFPIIETSDGEKLVFFDIHEKTNRSMVNICEQDLSHCIKSMAYDLAESVHYDETRSHLAFISKGSTKSTVVVLELGKAGIREKSSSLFDAVLAYNISANGEHVAVLGRRGEQYVLWKDGKDQPVSAIDAAFDLLVSDNGKAFFTAYIDNKVRLFEDGKPVSKEYSSITYPLIGRASGGSNIIFVAKRGEKSFVVMNGTEEPAFDMVVTPHLSADGSRLVYRVRDSGKRFVVIVDVKERTVRTLPPYEAVWDITFTPDGKSVGYGVKDGNKLIWKVDSL
ncbi:MAG: hypothetical protein ACYC7L_13120 [Nitrospirota bacterium]